MNRIENLSPGLVQYQPGDMTRYLFVYEKLPMFDGNHQIWCFSNLSPGFSFDSQQAIHEMREIEFPDNNESLWSKQGVALQALLTSWWLDDIIGTVTLKVNHYTILNGVLCWEELRRQKRI